MLRNRTKSSAAGRWATAILISFGLMVGGASMAQAASAPAVAVAQQATVAQAAPAAAVSLAAKGPVCNYTSVCGRLTNNGNVGIGIVKNWNNNPRWDVILYPGQDTQNNLGITDADGFFVGGGYCATTSPYYYYRNMPVLNYRAGYHKISDSQRLNIRAYPC